jgi:ParB family chromosome partitioning protein
MADTATLGTIEHIDPAQIEVETNIRTTVKLDPGFVASIREYGVLSPVGCRRTDDGTVTVRIGQRRVLAAREVGLATVPAYIVEGDDSTVERLLEQFVENEQRAALTEPERAQCPVVEYRTERSEGGYAAKAGHGACGANYDRRTGSNPIGNAS